MDDLEQLPNRRPHMTEALTVRQPQPQTAIATRIDVLEGVSFADLVIMGEQLARTGFLPDHIKTGAQFTAIVMTGRELGMTPMRAVRSLQMVKGKVVEDAASQLARFKVSGGRATFLHLDETRAVLEVTHPNGDKHVETWTLEDAKRAGLSGGLVSKFPRAMLRSRVITAALKSVGWDGAVGAYDPSELVDQRDETPAREPEVIVARAPTAPPSEVARILDLAMSIINAADVDSLGLAVSEIEETVHGVADADKRDRYRLALDGLVEHRACELAGADWVPAQDKRDAATRLEAHARKHRA